MSGSPLWPPGRPDSRRSRWAGSTLAATARRLGIAVPTVRSYLDRIRAKWAAADEPVDDVRDLIHEYRPQRDPG